MSTVTAFLAFDQPWAEVYPRVMRQMEDAGLRVLPTFDLQIARQAQKDCGCPHHGEIWCNCQMLVLLVYRNSGSPITLTLHGFEDSTWLSLADILGQRADPYLDSMIRRALTRPAPPYSPMGVICGSQTSI